MCVCAEVLPKMTALRSELIEMIRVVADQRFAALKADPHAANKAIAEMTFLDDQLMNTRIDDADTTQGKYPSVDVRLRIVCLRSVFSLRVGCYVVVCVQKSAGSVVWYRYQHAHSGCQLVNVCVATTNACC